MKIRDGKTRSNMSKSKYTKTHHARTTFGSWDVEKKCTPLWARSTFQSQHVKNTRGSDDFWTFRCRFAWQGRGLCTFSQVSKTWGFPKTMAGVGHLKRICKDAFRVAGAVQKTCSLEMLGGQGADCQVWKWRSLAKLFRFWRCQVQTLRKSRRISSCLMLIDRFDRLD